MKLVYKQHSPLEYYPYIDHKWYMFEKLSTEELKNMYKVELFDNLPEKQVYSWIANNLSENFTSWNKSGHYRTWYFDNENDALLFKLRWS